MSVDPSIWGSTTLAMTQAFTAFNTFLPPLSEVRKRSVDDAAFAADVRLGEIAGAGLALGFGALTSGITGSSTPVIAGALMAIGLIVLYESVLRSVDALEAKDG